MDDGAGRGSAEAPAARSLRPDPRADEGRPRLRDVCRDREPVGRRRCRRRGARRSGRTAYGRGSGARPPVSSPYARQRPGFWGRRRPARSWVRHAITRKEPLVRTTTQIEADVRAEIVLDPRIPDPDEIATWTSDGTVTLRGTVGSFAQRRAAVADARKIQGVYDVYDELEVRLLDDNRRDDAEIRGIALQMLMWDVEVPAELLDVHVTD